MTLDLENGLISFGINEVMFEPKIVFLKKFKDVHLAVWMNNTKDEVLLFNAS